MRNRNENRLSLTPGIPDRARMLLESMNARMASNAWVIGGERTASGKPILANDMHLPLRARHLVSGGAARRRVRRGGHVDSRDAVRRRRS